MKKPSHDMTQANSSKDITATVPKMRCPINSKNSENRLNVEAQICREIGLKQFFILCGMNPKHIFSHLSLALTVVLKNNQQPYC